MLQIRTAEEKDFSFLLENDSHISKEMLLGKIKAGEILIAEYQGEPVGWLRFNFFWDEIPFMNMLYIIDGRRKKGIGRALVLEWEGRMLALGYKSVMTSTVEEEEAKYFYRKLGYNDLGKFLPFSDEFELILGKDLMKKE